MLEIGIKWVEHTKMIKTNDNNNNNKKKKNKPFVA